MTARIGPAILNRVAAAEARQGQVEVKSGGVAAPDFIDPNFPVQRALLEDEASLLLALCTRRAAKSFSAAKRLLRAMYKHPGSSTLFLALTDDSAMNIIWKDCLAVINKRWNLGADLLESKQLMRLPNGSVLYIMGMDADEQERDKLLGGKYAEVAIDEGASFSTDLNELVFGTLKPAVADYRGAIGIYGTPGNVKAGLFFELTKDQDPSTPHRWKRNGWSGHCWDTTQNPYMEVKWAAEIAELVSNNPLIEQTPTFKKNYRGLWCIDDTLLVYKYASPRNTFDGKLPEFREGHWHYTLGVDTGWKASAFTLCAYHDHCRDLFVLESWKRRGMDVTAMALVIKDYEHRFELEQSVVDGANKQAVQEMNQRHGCHLQAADKRDKFSFIDLMNDDLIQARILVSTAKWEPERLSIFTDAGRCGTADYVSELKCGLLASEWATLVIDEQELKKHQKREEHPNCENHCADSALYPWRMAYPYLSTVLAAAPPKYGTPDWAAAQADRQRKEFEEESEKEFRANRSDHEDHQWHQDFE